MEYLYSKPLDDFQYTAVKTTLHEDMTAATSQDQNERKKLAKEKKHERMLQRKKDLYINLALKFDGMLEEAKKGLSELQSELEDLNYQKKHNVLRQRICETKQKIGYQNNFINYVDKMKEKKKPKSLRDNNGDRENLDVYM